MRELLTRQFGAFFTRAEKNDPGYADATQAEAQRYVVGRETTTDRLYMWLRDHAPAAPAAQERAERRAAPRKPRKRHQHRRSHR
jgi:hypothetical protein